MYEFTLHINSIGDVFDFEVSFFRDINDVPEFFRARGTCPSVEQCWDKIQEYIDLIEKQCQEVQPEQN